MRRFVLSVLCALAIIPTAAAGGPAEPTYWKDVRPLLRKHCIVCHSAKNVKEVDVSGGLALDSYEAVRKGTKHPVLQPGKSADSVLVHLLATKDVKKRMPLDAAPLPEESVALIRKWIDTGAKEGQKPDGVGETVV
ncbi:MAG TPA: c-type cytochrome domain-containing protein, partial [Gemmataceae bacterium]|nr:c-type cytochrome domain-containing protein [Gemmataceae bacterium]